MTWAAGRCKQTEAPRRPYNGHFEEDSPEVSSKQSLVNRNELSVDLVFSALRVCDGCDG